MIHYYGQIRIDETLIPITSLTPRRGGITLTCYKEGPIPALSGNWRWFSLEGEPVSEGAKGESTFVNLPAIRDGDSLSITLNLDFGSISSNGQAVIVDDRRHK